MSKLNIKKWRALEFFLLGFLIIKSFSLVSAGIMAETTRLIFPEGTTERSLMLANTNQYPVLVQTWVDNGHVNNTPEKTDSPFIVLPTVFKMGPGEVKGIRIVFKNQNLPKDRESVFWLNLYEMPPIGKKSSPSDESKLLMAMNTQMKIFYRPKNLAKKNDLLLENLQFTVMKEKDSLILTCHNSTPYFASFSSIKLLTKGRVFNPEAKLDMMVAPLTSERFVFRSDSLSKGQQLDLEFELIGDTGLLQRGEKKSIFTSD